MKLGLVESSWRTRAAVGLLIVPLLSCAPAADHAPDLILFNGKILTVDETFSMAEAVAITGGRFVAVGASDDVRALAAARTRQVDLAGLTVVPGLWDSHNHQYSRVARELSNASHVRHVDLSQVQSVKEIQAAIAERAQTVEAGVWIYGSRGWWEYRLDEQRLPNRLDLDEAAPRNPVVIPGPSHYVIANTMALTLSEIDRDTPDPYGGMIERDEKTGEPTGVLFDRAGALIQGEPPPSLTVEEELSGLRRIIDRQHSHGITSIREAGVGPVAVDAYRALLDAGQLTQRVDLWYRIDPLSKKPGSDGRVPGLPTLEPADPSALKSMSEIKEEASSLLSPGTTFGDGMIRIGGIKMILDGAERKAFLREEYPGQPGYHGVLFIPEEQLTRVSIQLNRMGWPVTAHAVGDAAIDVLLNAYEAANEDSSIVGKRWGIEHAFLVRPDHFDRASRLRLTVNSQYTHNAQLGSMMIRSWGERMANMCLPFKSWMEHGIILAGGSDGPISYHSDPMLILWGSVTRGTLWGGVLGPEQGLDREQALRTLTINAAYASFWEDELGSIEPGKYADLVILSDDYLNVPADAIKDIEVLVTMVGGEPVHGTFEKLSERESKR